MRSTLRSLTFGLCATLAAATMAQQPYTIFLSGTVFNCYPGQMLTVQTTQNTLPVLSFDVPVDPDSCTWSAQLGVSSTFATWQVSTPCNGQIASVSSFSTFGSNIESIHYVELFCAEGDPDCAGIPGGPNLPGTLCFNDLCQVGVWSAECVCALDTINPIDCMGEPGGPALPGTACDDGNPATQNDLWNCGCECAGENSGSEPDCAGTPGGSELPGTDCTDFFGNMGIWSLGCICETNANPEDCEGNPGGDAWPGTTCLYTPDSGNTWQDGIWSVDCVCGPDSTGFLEDCLGEVGGSAQPGTDCTIPGTTLEGTWSVDCICEPNNTDPCEANFWVIQAMGPDSLPVPYELWVWNLSSGGSGNFVFTWSFGDGTSSTEPFPTHTYSGNGPYNLCLTILDNNGCSDTFCDSVSINGDGIFEGMIVHAEDRQEGFTINVRQPQATGVQDISAENTIALWPNPVTDELNIAVVSGMRGAVTVSITDLDGRAVSTERMSLSGGRSQLRLATSGLHAGMYLLRVSDGNTNLSQRFVKAN